MRANARTARRVLALALLCGALTPAAAGAQTFSAFSTGMASFPAGVAVDQDGNVYVAERDRSLIQKFSNTGTLEASFGPGQSGNADLNQPIGVAVGNQAHNPDIYVTDQGSDKVLKLDSNGNVLLDFGAFSNPPTSVDVDEVNNVWVTDAGNDILVKFAPNGTLLNVYGKPGGGSGSGPGQFNNPLDVSTDPAGDTYVADSANIRVQKLDPLGVQIWQATGSGIGTPAGVDHDLTGNNWVTDSVGDVFSERDPNGAIVGSPIGGSGTAVGQFDGPYGIAVDCALNVFVADSGNDRVQRYGTVSTPPCSPPSNTASPEVSGDAESGSGLALDQGVWAGSPTPVLSQRWQRCTSTDPSSCGDIAGERDLTYTVTNADRGLRLRAVVVATNTEGTVAEPSDMTPIVPPVSITPLPPTPPSPPFNPVSPPAKPPVVERTGFATFDVTCNPTGATFCDVRGDLVGPGRKGAHKAAMVTLAAVSGQVRFGRTASFKLRLTKRGHSLLKSGYNARTVMRVFIDDDRSLTARLRLNRRTAHGFRGRP
jgi:streptogramin lyase